MITDLTPSDIIGLWPNAARFGEDLGLKRAGDHARVMKVRNRIPRQHWPRVLQAAAERNLPVTEELLKTAHGEAPAEVSGFATSTQEAGS